MQVILTPSVLNFLLAQGYNYCLSKTLSINKGKTDVTIFLTPVIERPQLELMPENYDTYFDLAEEPTQMAQGVDETEILVEISDLPAFKKFLLQPK